jgi:iron complex outermembrane recepter protein
MSAGSKCWTVVAIAGLVGSAGASAGQNVLPVFSATATAKLVADEPAPADAPSSKPSDPPSSAPVGAGPAEKTEAERRAGVGMQEILVTARKREETAQAVPLSLRAFSESEVSDRGIARISDLDNATPNLFVEQTSNDNNLRIYIRGVGTDDRSATVDPGVGVYIDGVYQARTFSQNFDVLDIERIEVLRGPQGTLYGRNTTGGTINLVTQKPTGEFGVKFKTEIGTYDVFNNSLAVSFPIVDEVLSGRVALESKYHGGYFENKFNGGDTNFSNDRNVAGRAQFNWIVSENLETTLSVDRNYRRDRPQGNNLNSVCTSATSVFCALGVVQSALAPLADNRTFEGFQDGGANGVLGTSVSDRNENVSSNVGVTLTTTYDLGESQLKWIAGGRRLEQRELVDLDATSLAFTEVADHDVNNQLSQEIQYNSSFLGDSLELVSGVYYFREDNKNEQSLRFASDRSLQSIPIVALLSRAQSGDGRTDQTLNTYAAYLNLAYDLTPSLTIDTGLRYSYDHKRFKRLETRLSGVTTTNSRDTEHFDDLSPQIGFQWRATDELQFYGKFSRAFRGGGFNGRANGTNPLTAEPFDPETVKVSELGLKSSFLDDRVVFNLSGYYTKFDDLQITTFTFDGAQFVSLVNNAAKARIVGLEAELFAQPIEGLLLSLGVGTIDTEYLTYREPVLTLNGPTTFVDASDREFKNTPDLSASTSVAYTFTTFRDSATTLRLDYAFRDEVFYNTVNNKAISQDKIGLLNGRITWRNVDESIELGFFGRNLLNREYDTFGFDLSGSLGFTNAYPAPPRELGVDLTLRY